ncbi:MAG: hypothetical protein E6J50_03765 [Chloroflexi bacterium]|nr:MAG: hypothetical protein E6J50_03765 [Chloroflexota bacterium]
MSESEASLQVAAATVGLTPPAGKPLGGYLLREGKTATGAHDPLEGSLIWLRDMHGGEVLWLAMDVVCVDEELAARIAAAVGQACGCATDAVLVCASHTHSSASGWVRGLGPMSPETADGQLREVLVDRLAAAAGTLPSRLAPCRAVFAEGHAPAAGGNRNDPTGPHDPSAGVLALVDAAGAVVAAIVDYASHATVLGHENLAWSADWPGAMRRALSGALAPITPFEPRTLGKARASTRTPPVIAFLQGAAGDASPRFVRRSQTFPEVDRIGGLVAGAALEALLAARPETGERRVAVRRAAVTVRTRDLPDLAEARRRSGELEATWLAARAAGVPAPEERIARTRYEGSLMLAALAEAGMAASVELPIAAVAVGEAAWIHLPVELFASYGLAIRERSPFGWTRVIGYTGGYFGYVADEAAHRNGVYEASASRFDARGGQTIADAALDLLRELATQVHGRASEALEGVTR